MARTGVTYLEVAQAASTIQHQGNNPTIDAVRRILGTGSNTTIATHLKQWRAEHQPAAMALSNTTLPPELLSQIQSLWDALKAKSQESIQALKEVHEKQASEFDAKIKALTQHNTELTSQNHQASQEIHTLENQLKQSQTVVTRNEKNLQQAHAKITELKARLADKDTSIKDLKEQTLHIQQNLEHFREAARQQREELILQQDNVQAELKQEIKSLGHKLTEEREKHSADLLEHEKQKYQSEKFASENQWLQNQSKERHEHLCALTAQLKLVQSQAEQLGEQCNTQDKQITQQRQELKNLNREKSEYKEKWIAAQAVQSEQSKMIERLSINKDKKPTKNTLTSA